MKPKNRGNKKITKLKTERYKIKDFKTKEK